MSRNYRVAPVGGIDANSEDGPDFYFNSDMSGASSGATTDARAGMIAESAIAIMPLMHTFLSAPELQVQGAVPDPVVSPSATGFTINLIYDAAALAAPASFRAGIQHAADLLMGALTDHITVNLKIDYSGTGGGASAGPDSGSFQSYSSVRSALINNATPGDMTFNS